MRTEPAPSTSLFSPGFAAWIKVAVVYQRASRRLATRLRPHDVTVAQFDALANLYMEDGITQQELARRMLVTKGNMTGLIGRLAERGWLDRRRDPRDGRAHRLHLTGAGRALAERTLRVQRRLVDAMMGGLSAAEREHLRALLDRVAEAVPAPTDDDEDDGSN